MSFPRLGVVARVLHRAARGCGVLRVVTAGRGANGEPPFYRQRSRDVRLAMRMVRRSLTCTFTTVSITAALAAMGSFLSSDWFHTSGSTMAAHVKALTSPYPGSQIKRCPVPPGKVSWSVEWPEYQPVEYTAPSVLAKPPWADPPLGDRAFCPRFNALDEKVQRESFEGTYQVQNGTPRNPAGRTGVIGRGLLGRWGPNHAADPIITRWKRDAGGKSVSDPVSRKPVLQFVAIQRKDCGQWAIPGVWPVVVSDGHVGHVSAVLNMCPTSLSPIMSSYSELTTTAFSELPPMYKGMVDPGELVTATLRREFCEEALNSLEKDREEKDTEGKVQSLFSQEPLLVYKGYVDDPRNTDNSWMETQAVNYHDETGHLLDLLPLEAGDDAGKVKWVDVSSTCSLYASHASFIKLVAEKHNANW